MTQLVCLQIGKYAMSAAKYCDSLKTLSKSSVHKAKLSLLLTVVLWGVFTVVKEKNYIDRVLVIC